MTAYDDEGTVSRIIASIDAAWTELHELRPKLKHYLDPGGYDTDFADDMLVTAAGLFSEVRQRVVRLDSCLRWPESPAVQPRDGDDDPTCVWIQPDGTRCGAAATGVSSMGYPWCGQHDDGVELPWTSDHPRPSDLH